MGSRLEDGIGFGAIGVSVIGMSIGVLDQSTGSLFSVDAFGAILPEPTQDASDVPPEVLAGGMLGWATSDSPWAHIVDRERFS